MPASRCLGKNNAHLLRDPFFSSTPSADAPRRSWGAVMPKLTPDVEEGFAGPKMHISRTHRTCYGIPRIIRILCIATIVLLLGREAAIRIQGDFDYKLKILPTDFEALAQRTPDALWTPQQAIRHLNGTGIGDRYVLMRHLGTGNEGSASLYVEVPTGEVVVVKTFTGPLKNIRNHVPDSLSIEFEDYIDKWPSEIEASLLLQSFNHGNDTAYVSVKDYFILDRGTGQWNWAMVTPFIEGGTLLTLAEATKVHERTPQKLDKIFRPAFNSLLDKLGELHEAGYCHDDIKPDNVFIASSTHWLLGDLGNVRHANHPWHATGRWKRENQKPDCKENDVRRMMKTYLSFLREAGASQAAFDDLFYEEDQAWSRLYGDYIDAPVSAQVLLTMSKDLRSGEGGDLEAGEERTEAEQACLTRSIDRELTFWSVETDWSSWVPFRGC